MLNEDIHKEIQKAQWRSDSPEKLKSLYLKRNALNFSLDKPIYRIFESKFFLEDLSKSQITLLRIPQFILADQWENPLLNKIFRENSELITLRGAMEDYFGMCWTEEGRDEAWRWVEFAHGGNGVRVKVNASRLMHEIANIKNKYLELQYFIGRVNYEDEAEIEKFYSERKFEDFLDSQGKYLALSLLTLKNDLSHEKEIRLIFNYMSQDTDNSFVDEEVVVEDKLCRHPFKWSSIVEEILIDPRMTDDECISFKKELVDFGLSCPINRSFEKIG